MNKLPQKADALDTEHTPKWGTKVKSNDKQGSNLPFKNQS